MMNNPTLNVLKGLGIALVVYGHVLQRSMAFAGEDFFLHPVFRIIYTFHMPLFVFISGYLLAASLQRKTVAEVFKSRYKSLFVPLVAWGLIGVLTSLMLNTLDKRIFERVCLRGVADYLANSMDIWFVWFLFVLFVLNSLLLLCAYLKPRFGGWIFLFVYSIVLAAPVNNFLSFYYVKWFYLFCLAGYFARTFGQKIIAKCNNAAVFFVCLVLFCFLAPLWNKGDYIYIHRMSFWGTADFVYRYFVGALGIAVMFFVGVFVAKTRFVKFWSCIGVFSFDIYLLQRYLVEGLYPRILALINPDFYFNSPFFLLVFVPALSAGFIGACIMISKLTLRKFFMLNVFLAGGRA